MRLPTLSYHSPFSDELDKRIFPNSYSPHLQQSPLNAHLPKQKILLALPQPGRKGDEITYNKSSSTLTAKTGQKSAIITTQLFYYKCKNNPFVKNWSMVKRFPRHYKDAKVTPGHQYVDNLLCVHTERNSVAGCRYSLLLRGR